MSEGPSINPTELVPVSKVLPERRPGRGATLFMRDGSFRMILELGGINFLMKSPMERESIAAAYGEFMHSLTLTMPLQISVLSRPQNMEHYLRRFDAALINRNTPDALKPLIAAHRRHLDELIGGGRLLSRRLYITISWRGIRPRARPDAEDSVLTWLRRKLVTEEPATPDPTDLDIATAQQQLDLRADQVEHHMSLMGVWARRLDEEDVRQLLWDCFHPGRLAR